MAAKLLRLIPFALFFPGLQSLLLVAWLKAQVTGPGAEEASPKATGLINGSMKWAGWISTFDLPELSSRKISSCSLTSHSPATQASGTWTASEHLLRRYCATQLNAAEVRYNTVSLLQLTMKMKQTPLATILRIQRFVGHFLVLKFA